MASPEKSLGGKKKSTKSSNKKSSSKSPKKHRIRAMHIEPTDNGGFMARHDYHGDMGVDGMQNVPDSTTHALGSPDDLLSHVQDHLGGSLPPVGGAAPVGPAAGGM